MEKSIIRDIECLMDNAYAAQHTGMAHIDLSDPAARAAAVQVLSLAMSVAYDAASDAYSLLEWYGLEAGTDSAQYQQARGAWSALRETAAWLDARYREANLERV